MRKLVFISGVVFPMSLFGMVFPEKNKGSSPNVLTTIVGTEQINKSENNENLSKENKILKTKLKSLKKDEQESFEMIENLEQENALLTKNLDKKKEEQKSQKQKIEKYEKMISSLEEHQNEQEEDKNKKINDLKNQIIKLNDKIGFLEKEIEENKRNSSKKKEVERKPFDGQESQYSDEMNDDEKKAFEEKIKASEEEIKALKKENNDLEEKIKALEEKNNDLEEENNKLNSNLSQIFISAGSPNLADEFENLDNVNFIEDSCAKIEENEEIISSDGNPKSFVEISDFLDWGLFRRDQIKDGEGILSKQGGAPIEIKGCFVENTFKLCQKDDALVYGWNIEDASAYKFKLNNDIQGHFSLSREDFMNKWVVDFPNRILKIASELDEQSEAIIITEKYIYKGERNVVTPHGKGTMLKNTGEVLSGMLYQGQYKE